MIENKLSKTVGEACIKFNVLHTVVCAKYPGFAPFETWRSRARQAWLYAQLKGKWPVAKPGTSMHEKGKGVDWIFKNSKGQVTRSGDYKYVQYVAAMCGLVWVKGESCHTQDNGKTIKVTMNTNSARYNLTKSASEQKLLSLVNTTFRKFWYK